MSLAALLLTLGWSAPVGQPEGGNVWRVGHMPAEHHPCLLFTADQLPVIRERIKRPPYADWWAGVGQSEDMVCQAFTWRLTGDGQKAKAVRERLLQCNPTGYHCCCGVADALQGVAEAYDLLYDYPGLSETDHRVIRAKIAQACERLYLSALETGNGQHPGNQRTRGICALGTAAMVLSGYRESAHSPQEWLQRALDGIHDPANLQFWRDDGMFIEGPTYSSFTLSVMLPFARYLDNFTGQWLFADPRLRNALEYLVYVTQPDGDCTAMGPTNMLTVVNSLRLAVGAGDPRDQAVFRWALDEWGSAGGGVREICLYDDGVKPSVAGVPTSRFFPVSQEAGLRGEWSRNAVALWLKGKDPWIAQGYGVYSHGDVGSFVLHAYGELLAVDGGYDHWVSYNLYPPELHNTLLVDGKGPVGETQGVMTNAIDAEYLQGATVESEYAGIRLRRTFLLVEREYVVIFDDVQADAEHDYVWQVHTPVSRKTGQVTIEENRASWTGSDPRTDNPGAVTLQVYWAGPVEVQAMERSRWQPFDPDPQQGSYDNWAVVARRHGRNVRYVTVLYPHPTDAPPPEIQEEQHDWGSTVEVRQRGRTERISYGNPTPAPGAPADGRPPFTVQSWAAGSTGWNYELGPGELRVGGDRLMALSGPGVASWPTGEPNEPWRAHVAGPAGMRVGLPDRGYRPRVLLAPDGRRLCQLPSPGADPWSFVLPEDLRGPACFVPPSSTQPFAPDSAPPRLTHVWVDGQEVEAAGLINLGRVESPPREVRARFEDEGTGINLVRVRTRLDGRECQRATARSPEGRRYLDTTVPIPPRLTPTDHELVVCLADCAPVPNATQLNLRFSLRPLLANGGFEEPGGWSFGSWSDDAATKYQIVPVADRPRLGRRCLMMRGLAGHLNLVASQTVPLKLGSTYRLSGYCRGDAPAGASLCNQAGTGQYAWSPPIGPAAEWTRFEWEFAVANPAPPLILALRLGNVGTAYFDDIELGVKAPVPRRRSP